MNLTKTQVGLFSGLLALILTPLFIFLAYLLEPTYNPLLQTISQLGVTPNGEIFFICGTIFGGLLLISFYFFYFSDFAKLDQKFYYSNTSGILSGIGLIGVGIFQDKPEFWYQVFHISSTVIFFLFMTLSILFCGLYFKSSNNSVWNKKLYYIACFIVFMSLMHLTLFVVNYPITIGILTFNISVIWQKLTVISLFIWFIPFFMFGKKMLKH